MYVNVAFPLRMKPLTYKLPEGSPADMAGRIVRAPLMGKSIAGLVMGAVEEPEMKIRKKVKEIHCIYQCIFSATALAFLQWLADYYLSPVGTALRSSFFDDIAADVVRGGKHDGYPRKHAASASCLTDSWTRFGESLTAIGANIRLGSYRSFLYHAGSFEEERALVIEALRHLKDSLTNAVILVPEIAHLEHLLPAIKELFGERVCVLHSRLGKKEVSGSLRRISGGVSDIVVGTRSAVLAPLEKVSFIAVLSEHSRSYKAEEGIRYNARDAAVMRGVYEKASVLLSSAAPSVESIYNAGIGKYVMLKTAAPEDLRPKIKIVSLKGSDTLLSPEILTEARRLAELKKRFLFLVSRKGYSLLRCEECGFIERCGTCDVPLVFYKGEDVLKCRYCGSCRKVPVSCGQCGGNAIKTFGAGTERIKEQVEALLKSEAIVIEKGGSGLKSRRLGLPVNSDLAPVVIGTSTPRSGNSGLFGSAAFLNMDSLLLQPDFRLYERALQEVSAAVQMVRNDGTVFLQTRMPRNRILRFIRSYDFSGFYRYELLQRKSFNNPPFARLILFTLPVTGESGASQAEIDRIAQSKKAVNVEILGPVELPYQSKKYHYCIQVLLKSKERTALHAAARAMLEEIGKVKRFKKIIVDVDPVRI